MPSENADPGGAISRLTRGNDGKSDAPDGKSVFVPAKATSLWDEGAFALGLLGAVPPGVPATASGCLGCWARAGVELATVLLGTFVAAK